MFTVEKARAKMGRSYLEVQGRAIASKPDGLGTDALGITGPST